MAPADSPASTVPARRGALLFAGVLVVAGLVQMALFAYVSMPGLAGTSDSRLYLHAAQTLRDTGHLLNPDGTPYRYWPPMYPMLLRACSSLPGIEVLHGICLLVSLLLWSWLGRQLLPLRQSLVLPALLALSTPWLLVSKFVWSESLFILLFAAYACCLFQWLRLNCLLWWLVVTAVGFLMPLERTLGLFLLAGVGFGFMLSEWRRLLATRRWLWLALHLALSTTGGVWWQWYALHAGPSRYHPSRGWEQLISSMADYGFVLGRWLLLLPAAGRPLLPAAAWAAMLLLLFWCLWPHSRARLRADAGLQLDADAAHYFDIKEVTMPKAVPAPPSNSVLMLRMLWGAGAVLVILVAALTVFAQSAAGIHDAERYASVLFAPVMLLVLAAWPMRAPRWLGLVAAVALLVFAGGRVGHVARDLRRVPTLSSDLFPSPGAHGQRVGAAGQ
jgi:hypothetical protein